MDLISVIVPVYNVEKYLNRCVDSIINQTYSNLEIILIDDESTDTSGKICDEYKEKDERIHVIHQKNGGAATARNAGLNIALGKYIMFVDADDYVDKNICYHLLQTLIETNSECCFCGYKTFDENNDKIKEYAVKRRNTLTGIDALRKRYIDNLNYINVVEPWGKLFKSDMWENLRFSDGMYYEDLDIVPYLYLECSKVTIENYAGYYYFLRDESCSRGTGKDDKRYVDSLKIRNKHIELYKKYDTKLYEKNIEILLELIFTSFKNNWVPKKYIELSNELFHKYRKECKIHSLKIKIRYFLFEYFKI